MRLLRLTDETFEENCYLLIIKQDVYVIDPGFSYEKISELIQKESLNLKGIFLTHGHIDHTGDTDKLSSDFNNAPIYVSEEDSNLLFDPSLNCSKDFGFPKKYSLDLNVMKYDYKNDNLIFKVYKTPGHTHGSVILKYEDFLFTGDTLFKNSIGRTDFVTGSINEMTKSLEFIKKSFSKSTTILPGHYNKTTLKDELKNNDYLRGKR